MLLPAFFILLFPIIFNYCLSAACFSLWELFSFFGACGVKNRYSRKRKFPDFSFGLQVKPSPAKAGLCRTGKPQGWRDGRSKNCSTQRASSLPFLMPPHCLSRTVKTWWSLKKCFKCLVTHSSSKIFMQDVWWCFDEFLRHFQYFNDLFPFYPVKIIQKIVNCFTGFKESKRFLMGTRVP